MFSCLVQSLLNQHSTESRLQLVDWNTPERRVKPWPCVDHQQPCPTTTRPKAIIIIIRIQIRHRFTVPFKESQPILHLILLHRLASLIPFHHLAPSQILPLRLLLITTTLAATRLFRVSQLVRLPNNRIWPDLDFCVEVFDLSDLLIF